jgi:hypothetical protein
MRCSGAAGEAKTISVVDWFGPLHRGRERSLLRYGTLDETATRELTMENGQVVALGEIMLMIVMIHNKPGKRERNGVCRGKPFIIIFSP